MEQIIVLLVAAIANWALFAYALKCDKAKQVEPRKAELRFYFSELAFGDNLGSVVVAGRGDFGLRVGDYVVRIAIGECCIWCYGLPIV